MLTALGGPNHLKPRRNPNATQRQQAQVREAIPAQRHPHQGRKRRQCPQQGRLAAVSGLLPLVDGLPDPTRDHV
ncbi:MAG: hypothetical protein [Microvirus sp.]|nr:MAG: hypothetical protein [Microvirus sp.]